MRLLSVHVGFGPLAGGAAERHYQMAHHLLEAGVDVHLLLTDKWLEGGEAPQGYPFPRERIAALPLINRRFDVTLPRRGVVDAAVRDTDVIDIVQYMSPIVPAVCSAARRHRKPWVVSPVGVLPLRGRSMALKHVFQRLWGDRILREASRLIAVTPDEQATIAPYAASPDRVVVIPNAIVDRPPSAASPVPDGSRPFLLFLGGFHHTKGADLLIEAFAQVCDTHLSAFDLVLAGGSRRGAIEALVDRYGLRKRVRFAGWLSGEEKERALTEASFVVIPSRLDAMTIVVLEAAVARKPVLMTTGCGLPDLTELGGGHLVEATVDGLRQGLQWMVDQRERWPEMSDRMKRLVERYSWSVMTQRYIDVFRDVANEILRS